MPTESHFDEYQSSINSYIYPQFIIDEQTGRIEVYFIDRATGRIIRYIPATELHEIVQRGCPIGRISLYS